MPRQPDLIGQSSLNIAAAKGRTEPRLWIRRLVIWSDPTLKPIRDIALRPGLNIVWSPDGTEQATSEPVREAMGHGGGKTLFCRLLRYCLGEPRFASEEQRLRIAELFPEGAVGAEIIIDGRSWAIVRPFAARRRHLALAGLTLEEAIAGSTEHDGIEPFLEAVTAAFFPQETAALVPGRKNFHDAWLIALAWLTRDQECRFNHVLDWRSADSESGSPARGLSKTELLDALRVFLRALAPDEQACRARIADLEARGRSLEKERDHLAWQTEQTRLRLMTELAVPAASIIPGQMSVAPLAQAAQVRLAAVSGLADQTTQNDMDTIRRQRDEAQDRLTKALERQAAIDAELPQIERIIARIRSEVPGLSYSQHEAENPACPVCEVPIARALAEGCKLSHKLPDLESIAQRRDRNRQELTAESGKLTDLNNEKRALLPELALARQELERNESRLRTLEAAHNARESAWYGARRLVDEVGSYAVIVDRHDTIVSDLRTLESDIEKLRESAAAFRDKQASVFARLTERFDAIIRELVGAQAKGRATLGATSLALTVNLGGDRSTAAIESLKIIAFDLAALALSIEGYAATPEFLVHDSPREADLGLPLYHRLFDLIHRLEQFGECPRFQYIVTTTTRPPYELERDPWLRLTLKGFPSSERLLQCDL